ncbi:endonuclease domain-containing protein [Paenibacillus montanisoli]|uniref:endonuclease domain-containing protein n=1 Tax=Paenibacillus montanisoli TaxID=2081970 RepID=UPI001402E5F5|nr:DUF559 domain-containing protein [Paenibacillus montanisoli]
MADTQYKDPIWLRQKYLVEGLSLHEIAKLCGVGHKNIDYWCKKFGIDLRKKSDAVKKHFKEKKVLYTNDCWTCEEPFPVDGLAQTREGTKAFVKYCSDECRRLGFKRSHKERRGRFFTVCKNDDCGKWFEVEYADEADPSKPRKYKRACSEACTNALKSKNLKVLHAEGRMDAFFDRIRGSFIRKVSKETLIKLLQYDRLLRKEIAARLKIKLTVLRREFQRHEIENVFYNTCPHCNEPFPVPIRSMTNEESNKFKKYCSRICFLGAIKKKDTWIEKAVLEYLTEKEIEFVPQMIIGNYICDFFISSANLIVEAFGDYWHVNPDIYGVTKKVYPQQIKFAARDEIKLENLRAAGYQIIIVWENDLLQRRSETLDGLLQDINYAVNRNSVSIDRDYRD